MSEVVIVDHGTGNTGSLLNMFRKLGVEAETARDPEVAVRARRLVLPGVGAFDDGMRNLRATGLADAILQRDRSAALPLLGVCLGMQLLLDGSEEGSEGGLGLIPGKCSRFPAFVAGQQLRVPHMGWSTVEPVTDRAPVPGVAGDARYYFVHSYHAVVDDSHVAGWTNYGLRFPSVIRRGPVMGVQFHPEKSHRHGMRLLAEFARQ